MVWILVWLLTLQREEGNLTFRPSYVSISWTKDLEIFSCINLKIEMLSKAGMDSWETLNFQSESLWRRGNLPARPCFGAQLSNVPRVSAQQTSMVQLTQKRPFGLFSQSQSFSETCLLTSAPLWLKSYLFICLLISCQGYILRILSWVDQTWANRIIC